MKEHSALQEKFLGIKIQSVTVGNIVKNTQIQEKEWFKGILLAMAAKFKSDELGHH